MTHVQLTFASAVAPGTLLQVSAIADLDGNTMTTQQITIAALPTIGTLTGTYNGVYELETGLGAETFHCAFDGVGALTSGKKSYGQVMSSGTLTLVSGITGEVSMTQVFPSFTISAAGRLDATNTIVTGTFDTSTLDDIGFRMARTGATSFTTALTGAFSGGFVDVVPSPDVSSNGNVVINAGTITGGSAFATGFTSGSWFFTGPGATTGEFQGSMNTATDSFSVLYAIASYDGKVVSGEFSSATRSGFFSLTTN
jgi:hypothetical protein